MSDAARGAPSGSPPGTRCSSPPAAAAASRREPQDGAPSAATPAAEPEKAAAAEPSPPSARSRPHLWQPPHQPRLLELRPRTRLQRGSTGRYPPARAGRSSPQPGLPGAPRLPPLSNPPAAPGPLPVAVPAARHFRGRGGRSRRARARGLGAVRHPELPRYQPASRCSRAARSLLNARPGSAAPQRPPVSGPRTAWRPASPPGPSEGVELAERPYSAHVGADGGGGAAAAFSSTCHIPGQEHLRTVKSAPCLL